MSSLNILGYATLMDVMSEYSSMDGGAALLSAAKVLTRACPLLERLPMVQSNQIISNIGSRETSIGTASTRRFNEGVLPTDTKSAPYSDPIALFEDYSEVDVELWRIQNDPNAWRRQRDERKLRGIRQGVEYNLFYDAIASNPGGFDGLATRFNVSTHRPNGDTSWDYNVMLAGGSGSDTASIWVLELGPDKVFGIYPKNIAGGLQIEDLGESTKEEYTASGTKLHQVLRTHLKWYLGLGVGDERCAQRIANIETSGSTNIFDDEDLIDMINRLPGSGQDPATFIFVPRSIKTQMDKRALTRENMYYTQLPNGDAWGRPVTAFQGIPVFVAEKLLKTETAIS